MSEKLTQERLKELLNYNPETGVFRWKVSRPPNVKIGGVAGCVVLGENRQIRVCGRTYKAARLAHLYMNGKFPDTRMFHIDGIKDNDKWNNIDPMLMNKNNPNKITQDRLKDLLHYNPATGIFTWKIDRGRHIKAGDTAGHKNKKGYIIIVVDLKPYKAARLAWLYMEGYFPVNFLVDHEDRIRHNDRWGNLRLVGNQCNAQNCSLSKRNKSGVTGVYLRKTGAWRAYVCVNRKLIHLGSFKSKLGAVMARWKGEIEYGFAGCKTKSGSYKYLKEAGVV